MINVGSRVKLNSPYGCIKKIVENQYTVIVYDGQVGIVETIFTSGLTHVVFYLDGSVEVNIEVPIHWLSEIE